MANPKSHFFIVHFMVVTLFGQTIALSEVLPVQEVITNQLEQDQNQVDVDEAISPQEQETDLTSSIIDAMAMIADRLEAEQEKHYDPKGSWPAEPHFTGSIVAGMVSAYELTGESSYKTSAELGGHYILRHAEGNFYGDEAFALLRLSQISENPYPHPWPTPVKAVSDFYSALSTRRRTNDYISGFVDTDPSTAVFYLANHVVAAYYVDARDKQAWREALIDYLAQVDDDSSGLPVMALGIATWALALTGPLDNTPIDPSGTGTAYWNGKTIADLPGVLLSHQVPDGEPYAGSFYWRFDHGDGGSGGPVSGYTEDAIFTTLGLIAASRGDPALDLDAAIYAAGQALLGGVKSEGNVFMHLWLESPDYYTFGGEMLQVLGEWAVQENWPIETGGQ